MEGDTPIRPPPQKKQTIFKYAGHQNEPIIGFKKYSFFAPKDNHSEQHNQATSCKNDLTLHFLLNESDSI